MLILTRRGSKSPTRLFPPAPCSYVRTSVFSETPCLYVYIRRLISNDGGRYSEDALLVNLSFLTDTGSLSCMLGSQATALNFKLLPSSSLQQTDRYLLMNPHASVTLARSEARGEHPLLLSGLLLHRFLDKMEGSGQRSRAGSQGFKLFHPCKSSLGLMVWIKNTKCKRGKKLLNIFNVTLFPDSQIK